MANVKNCRKCGKIYNYVMGPNICPACREGLEEKFQRTKEYIRENGKATMSEVSENCEVEVSQLRQWIREERLQFSDDSPIKVNCEGCGVMIGSGRYCNKCKSNLINGLNPQVPKEVPKEMPKRKDSNSQKMRFLQ